MRAAQAASSCKGTGDNDEKGNLGNGERRTYLVLKATERPPTKRIRTFVWPRRGGLIACGSVLLCIRHGGSGELGSRRERVEEKEAVGAIKWGV